MRNDELVEAMRKRAEIRAKIDRGEGKVDRISAQLLEAADTIERLREALGWVARNPDSTCQSCINAMNRADAALDRLEAKEK